MRKILLKSSLNFLCPIVVFFLSCESSETTPEMVYIQGQTLRTFVPYTSEIKEVEIPSFFIDKQLVSYDDFEKFVQKTKYVTEAEKFGNSVVFDYSDAQWKIENGINFKHPQKSNVPIESKDHPVTQISWNDAKCYCEYLGKRLPTDAEWELAAKNGDGTYNKLYSWGDKAENNGRYSANFWQGNFPYKNFNLDGFLYTSPVGYFGENQIGMSDMGGNVWQWCQDDISPTPNEAIGDTAMRKVLRGGSFLCDPAVCHGFNIHGRSSSTPETGSSHVGFRCVKNAQK